MNCEDYKWGDFIKPEDENSQEWILARRYILSTQMKEDLHVQDQKYWDYHNYVINLNKANGSLWNEVCKLHEEQRSKNGA